LDNVTKTLILLKRVEDYPVMRRTDAIQVAGVVSRE
jgi:hypothetical protein